MESLDGRKRVCPSLLKAPATASAPARASSRPSITGRGSGNGQRRLKQAEQKSEQQREERERTENAGGEGGGSPNPRCGGEKDRKSERGSVVSGYPPSPCRCLFLPVASFMAPWLLDPGVCCHFSALRCHSAPGPRSALGWGGGGGGVSSAELEPHTVVVRQCRNCDGLNVTGELLTFGPEMTDKNQMVPWQHPFTHGHFTLAVMRPKAAHKQPKAGHMHNGNQALLDPFHPPTTDSKLLIISCLRWPSYRINL